MIEYISTSFHTYKKIKFEIVTAKNRPEIII